MKHTPVVGSGPLLSASRPGGLLWARMPPSGWVRHRRPGYPSQDRRTGSAAARCCDWRSSRVRPGASTPDKSGPACGFYPLGSVPGSRCRGTIGTVQRRRRDFEINMRRIQIGVQDFLCGSASSSSFPLLGLWMTQLRDDCTTSAAWDGHPGGTSLGAGGNTCPVAKSDSTLGTGCG